MKIVGLCGKAGSGKDSAAKALILRGWSKYSFADPIRSGLSAMLGIPVEDMLDTDIKNAPDYKYGKSIRLMLQTLGTEWGRDCIHSDLWVLRGLEICKDKECVVIPDVRFENEAIQIREAGGIVIQIQRENKEYDSIVQTSGKGSHASEAGIPPELIDFTIDNNDSIQTLHNQVLAIVNRCYK